MQHFIRFYILDFNDGGEKKMSFKRKEKWNSYITVFIFCILIFGFMVITVIQSPKNFSETENRVLKQKPEMNIESLINGEFETNYEEYLTDQFVFRDQWIGLKTTVEKIFWKKESKDIYFAKDDYLIEKHSDSFTTDMARRNRELLSQFVNQYQGQFGKNHISVMIVPNAVDILKHKLPSFASPYNEDEYLAQIAKTLPENVWFDAASVLREHQNEDIFYRTDHHWKTIAAFYVYQEWAKKQGYHVPEITDYKIKTVTDDFEGTIQSKLGIKTTGDTIELFLPKTEIPYTVKNSVNEIESSLYDDSALDTKDKYAVYFGGNQEFLKIHTESDNKRKILVIKDSYANCFIPFMIGEFQEIDILDLRYTKQKLNERIKKGGYTDLLVLYNASGFAEDMNIAKLINK